MSLKLEARHDAVDKNSYLSDYVLALDNAEKTGNMVTVKEIRLQLAALWEVKTDSKDVPHPKTVLKATRTLGFKESRLRSGMAVIWDERIMERLRVRFATPATPATPTSTLNGVDGVGNVANSGGAA